MKTNAGYEIIMEMSDEWNDGANGVALGFMEKSFGPELVTWEWTQFPNEKPSYFWGHYFSDKNKAMKDYYERCAKHFDRMGSFV